DRVVAAARVGGAAEPAALALDRHLVALARVEGARDLELEVVEVRIEDLVPVERVHVRRQDRKIRDREGMRRSDAAEHERCGEPRAKRGAISNVHVDLRWIRVDGGTRGSS